MNKLTLKQQHAGFMQLASEQIKVLVAEDNPINLLLMTNLLKKSCCYLATAENGVDAIATCNELKFDLILIDIHMPKIDGITAARKIRHASKYNKDTPILAISANSNFNESKILADAGVNQFLQKPLTTEMLDEAIIKWVQLDKPKRNAIDWELCLKLMSGKEVYAKEILEKLVQQLEMDRESIIDEYESQHYKKLSLTLHKLHGACCYCGVPQLKSLVKELEIQIKSGHYENLADLYCKLVQEIDLVLQEYSEDYA